MDERLWEGIKILVAILALIGIIISGYVFAVGFSGDIGIPSVSNPFENPEPPDAQVSFLSGEMDDEMYVDVTLEDKMDADYVRIQVQGDDSEDPEYPPEELHRDDNTQRIERLQHNDVVEVYAVDEDSGVEQVIDTHTVEVTRPATASFESTQEYNNDSGTYTVELVMTDSNADWVMGVTPGDFTSDSGDNQDHNDDGETRNDINIVRNTLIVEDLEEGEEVRVYGSVYGKTNHVYTYTVRGDN